MTDPHSRIGSDGATEFDLIVYGATGFTGRLVAEYLAQSDATNPRLRFALAGRNAAALAAVRDLVGAPADTPLVIADAHDAAGLQAMVARAGVVISAVGPYQLYGSALVAACAATGTHYVDLCGEPLWMRTMIDAHQQEAQRTGARIVFSCGFDSIPLDLGVWSVQQAARERYGRAAPRVKARVRTFVGGYSGGTAASLGATLAAIAERPELVAQARDPFLLTPGFEGARQPTGAKPEFDPSIGAWVAPFIMAPINTKTIHRSNFLLHGAYGEDFVYDEMIVVSGERDAAEAVANANPLAGDDAPKPGEGPSREERERGCYSIQFIGEYPQGERVEVLVSGDRDPGYGSTSKMIAESALCLVEDMDGAPGGLWTPAALMAEPLRRRLIGKAGLTFTSP